MSVSTDDTIFTSCFAAFIYNLFGETDRLEEKYRREWLDFILSYQEEKTGFFIDKEVLHRNLDDGHDMRYVTWQLTTFCLSAVHALGGELRHPLRFVEAEGYRRPETIQKVLESFNWRFPWRSGNLAMFLGIFLIWDAEARGVGLDNPAVRAFFDWHDAFQNPKTGFWGEGRLSEYHNGLFGAYHQYLLYFYTGRELHYKERIIDRILSFQNVDGMFAPQMGGGGCEDIDAIDTLVHLFLRTGYREKNVKECLAKANQAIRKMEAHEGGFIWGIRKRYGPKMFARNVFSLWGQPDLHQWLFVNRRFIREQLNPLKPWHPQGWVSRAIPIDESDLFSTWFRLLALAYCSKVVETPLSGVKWNFLESPGLGWFGAPTDNIGR
jgi:hypothetical protein